MQKNKIDNKNHIDSDFSRVNNAVELPEPARDKTQSRTYNNFSSFGNFKNALNMPKFDERRKSSQA